MNPFLEKMGYQPEDRVLITHIDDMGFCHAANVAAVACLKSGAASCAPQISCQLSVTRAGVQRARFSASYYP